MRRSSCHNDNFDAAFDALLAVSMHEYELKQRAFAEELSLYKKWHYTYATCTLELRRYFFMKKRFAFTPIGTFLPSTMNWCWAWANDIHSPEIRERASAVKALYEKTQYNVFLGPHFNVDYPEIDELCALALHALGGRGVFKIKESEPWSYLAIH